MNLDLSFVCIAGAVSSCASHRAAPLPPIVAVSEPSSVSVNGPMFSARELDEAQPAVPRVEPEPPPPASRVESEPPPPVAQIATSPCVPADWSERHLEPLLRSGRGDPSHAAAPILLGEGRPMTDILGNDSPCSDFPGRAYGYNVPQSAILSNGVRVALVDATPAGQSGRGWPGNQCQYAVDLADGSGRSVILGNNVIPPFNSIYSVLRRGSAVFIGIQFNGYAREFPRGGCKVIAADLCTGDVKWESANFTSNGDLVLVGDDHLLTGYGFTAEKRIIQVTNVRTGKVIQTLKIPGNPESFQFMGNQLTVSTNHGPAMFRVLP